MATGHPAGDQAETVLHRLLRGSGLDGLRGIAVRRPLTPAVGLVRPLLSVRRADVLAYLADLGQPVRDDASNRDLRFTRNRIRHELLPFLAKEYNSRVVEVLNSFAEQAAAVQQEMELLATQLLAETELPRAGNVCVFDATKLAIASRHQLRGMWQLVWRRENWPRGEMGFAEWDRLAGLCLGESTAHDFPCDIHARHAGRVVRVGPQS